MTQKRTTEMLELTSLRLVGDGQIVIADDTGFKVRLTFARIKPSARRETNVARFLGIVDVVEGGGIEATPEGVAELVERAGIRPNVPQTKEHIFYREAWKFADQRAADEVTGEST